MAVYKIIKHNNVDAEGRTMLMLSKSIAAPVGVTLLVAALHVWHIHWINFLVASYVSDVLSHAIIFLLLWSYWKCCTTNSFVPHDAAVQLVSSDMCSICRIGKAQRTHHCRKCKCCVLKMDHHCPWVGHCVGKENYKYYILFLTYTTMSLCDATIASIRRIISPHGWPTSAILLTVVVTLGQIVLMCSVGYLLLWHAMQLSHNCTTIEWYQAQKNSRQNVSELARFPWPSTFPLQSPYDNGLYQNVAAVFGNGSMLLWLVPTRQSTTMVTARISLRTTKNIV